MKTLQAQHIVVDMCRTSKENAILCDARADLDLRPAAGMLLQVLLESMCVHASVDPRNGYVSAL